MGNEVIEREMVDELQGVAADILTIASDHRKCLACHCYREVAEEVVGTLDLLSGHSELLDGEVPVSVGDAVARLRDLLASAKGTHG
jgi:hypothetical protein